MVITRVKSKKVITRQFGSLCGTAFQLICDKLTLAVNDLSGY